MIEEISKMQIDMPDNIILGPAGNGLESPKKSDSSGRISTDSADAKLRAEHSSIIDKSLELSEVDSEAVEQARQALSSGELDSPEAEAAAAENILKHGI